METKYKRLLQLEEKAMTKGFKLTEQQIRLLEKASLEIAEHHLKSDYPGQLLCQDAFYGGRLKGVGRIYLQVEVDTCGSFTFGYTPASTRRPRRMCSTIAFCRSINPMASPSRRS